MTFHVNHLPSSWITWMSSLFHRKITISYLELRMLAVLLVNDIFWRLACWVKLQQTFWNCSSRHFEINSLIFLDNRVWYAKRFPSQLARNAKTYFLEKIRKTICMNCHFLEKNKNVLKRCLLIFFNPHVSCFSTKPSLETSRWGDSHEKPQDSFLIPPLKHMFQWRYKKTILWIPRHLQLWLNTISFVAFIYLFFSLSLSLIFFVVY